MALQMVPVAAGAGLSGALVASWTAISAGPVGWLGFITSAGSNLITLYMAKEGMDMAGEAAGDVSSAAKQANAMFFTLTSLAELVYSNLQGIVEWTTHDPMGLFRFAQDLGFCGCVALAVLVRS